MSAGSNQGRGSGSGRATVAARANLAARAGPVVLAALVALSWSGGGASARGRSVPPKEIVLTELIVRKVIACRRSVEQAEERATGGVGSFYRNRMRLREAALARCGFPKSVTWRDADATVRTATEDLDLGDGLPEPRATNRKAALPFRAELLRMQ